MATRTGNGKYQRPETTLIFRTVHGSHLYGLDHEGSDMDVYEVYEGSNLHLNQTISIHGIDVVVGTLEGFVRRAQTGSHQSVEALFSPVKEFTPEGAAKYGPFLAGFRITGSEVFAKYERTIHKFCFGDFKRRRHAVRLAINLQDLRMFGRFNPQMTREQKIMANEYATNREGEALWTALTS